MKLKSYQSPRELNKYTPLRRPIVRPKKLVFGDPRPQKSNSETSEDVRITNAPVKFKFIDLLLQVLTSYATAYEDYIADVFAVDPKEVSLLDFLMQIEMKPDSALNGVSQSEHKRVLPLLNKVIEALKTDEHFREAFQFALNDNFGGSKTSLAEKWMMAWFICKNNMLGMAKMWSLLYRKSFPYVSNPSKYALFMVHSCQHSSLQLFGFVLWVREIEGSVNALLSCSFIQEFIRLHYHNSLATDQFIEMMSSISADQLSEEFQRYRVSQKKATFNFPYRADFKDILHRGVTFVDAPELFSGIYASLGMTGLQNFLFLLSGEDNKEARKAFNRFVREDSVVPLHDKVKLFQFALFDKTGRAWLLLEKIFFDNAYQLFYQGVPQALLMLRNDWVQLARFSDQVLLKTLDELDARSYPPRGAILIIHFYRNLVTQRRSYKESTERLQRINRYFDSSELDSWPFPSANPQSLAPEGIIKAFLNSYWELLIEPESSLIKDVSNTYERLASSTSTFKIMMVYFAQHLNIEERVNFIHKKFYLDKSIFSIAVQHPDLLQTLLSSFCLPEPETYQWSIQHWLLFAAQLKAELNATLLGKNVDYLEALKFYIIVVTLIQSASSERDLTEKFCSALCRQSDTIRSWVEQNQPLPSSFVKRSSEHDLCNLSFNAVKTLSFFSNSTVSSNNLSQEGLSPSNNMDLSLTTFS